jgi:hypothetical protein
VIEPLSQSDRACNPLHHRTLLSVSPLWHRQHVGRVMVKTPLAFEFSKTRCDAFDEAWALLQGLGTDLTDASKSHATRTTLAKRIIEMANQGLRDIPELRDDALAFLQHSPPSAWRNGLGEAIGAQTAALAELSRVGSFGETPQPAATGAHSMAGMGLPRGSAEQ